LELIKIHASLSFSKATVLVGKLEVMIFEEAVHEDDELASFAKRS
jgi:hypothetical protein